MIYMQVIKLGKLDAQGGQLDVFSNFGQYGLTPRLSGLLRMDMHLNALRPGLEEVSRGKTENSFSPALRYLNVSLMGSDVASVCGLFSLIGMCVGTHVHVELVESIPNQAYVASKQIFHSIIGDPPYGVRAGGRKSVAKSVEIRDRDTHIVSTAPYMLGECLRDLLDVSARLLVLGGRLVYFFPTGTVCPINLLHQY